MQESELGVEKAAASPSSSHPVEHISPATPQESELGVEKAAASPSQGPLQSPAQVSVLPPQTQQDQAHQAQRKSQQHKQPNRPRVVLVDLGDYHTSLLRRILWCRAKLVRQLRKVPASTVQVDQAVFSCRACDTQTMEGVILRLQDQVKEHLQQGQGGEHDGAEAQGCMMHDGNGASEQQKALAQVYVAILSLSTSALILVEHGISMSYLYLQHMQDCLPRIITMCESAFTPLSDAYQMLSKPGSKEGSPDAATPRVPPAGRTPKAPTAAAAESDRSAGGSVEEGEAGCSIRDHPRLAQLDQLLTELDAERQGAKVLVVADPCTFFSIYRSVISTGLQPRQFDRGTELLLELQQHQRLQPENLQHQDLARQRPEDTEMCQNHVQQQYSQDTPGHQNHAQQQLEHKLRDAVESSLHACQVLLVSPPYLQACSFPYDLFAAVVELCPLERSTSSSRDAGGEPAALAGPSNARAGKHAAGMSTGTGTNTRKEGLQASSSLEATFIARGTATNLSLAGSHIMAANCAGQWIQLSLKVPDLLALGTQHPVKFTSQQQQQQHLEQQHLEQEQSAQAQEVQHLHKMQHSPKIQQLQGEQEKEEDQRQQQEPQGAELDVQQNQPEQQPQARQEHNQFQQRTPSKQEQSKTWQQLQQRQQQQTGHEHEQIYRQQQQRQEYQQCQKKQQHLQSCNVHQQQEQTGQHAWSDCLQDTLPQPQPKPRPWPAEAQQQQPKQSMVLPFRQLSGRLHQGLQPQTVQAGSQHVAAMSDTAAKSQRPIVVTSRRESLIVQRSELYEGILALEKAPQVDAQRGQGAQGGHRSELQLRGQRLSKQRGGLGLEVIERDLDLEDVVLTPGCCVCVWKLPEAGQAADAKTLVEEIKSRVSDLSVAYSQVHVIVETSDSLCSQLALQASSICEPARLKGTQLHLLTSGSPLNTQPLVLHTCSSIAAAYWEGHPGPESTGMASLHSTTAAATFPAATAARLSPSPPALMVPLEESPSPLEALLTCCCPSLNPLSAACLMALLPHLPPLPQQTAQVPQPDPNTMVPDNHDVASLPEPQRSRVALRQLLHASTNGGLEVAADAAAQIVAEEAVADAAEAAMEAAASGAKPSSQELNVLHLGWLTQNIPPHSLQQLSMQARRFIARMEGAAQGLQKGSAATASVHPVHRSTRPGDLHAGLAAAGATSEAATPHLQCAHSVLQATAANAVHQPYISDAPGVGVLSKVQATLAARHAQQQAVQRARTHGLSLPSNEGASMDAPAAKRPRMLPQQGQQTQQQQQQEQQPLPVKFQYKGMTARLPSFRQAGSHPVLMSKGVLAASAPARECEDPNRGSSWEGGANADLDDLGDIDLTLHDDVMGPEASGVDGYAGMGGGAGDRGMGKDGTREGGVAGRDFLQPGKNSTYVAGSGGPSKHHPTRRQPTHPQGLSRMNAAARLDPGLSIRMGTAAAAGAGYGTRRDTQPLARLGLHSAAADLGNELSGGAMDGFQISLSQEEDVGDRDELHGGGGQESSSLPSLTRTQHRQHQRQHQQNQHDHQQPQLRSQQQWSRGGFVNELRSFHSGEMPWHAGMDASPEEFDEQDLNSGFMNGQPSWDDKGVFGRDDPWKRSMPAPLANQMPAAATRSTRNLFGRGKRARQQQAARLPPWQAGRLRGCPQGIATIEGYEVVASGVCGGNASEDDMPECPQMPDMYDSAAEEELDFAGIGASAYPATTSTSMLSTPGGWGMSAQHSRPPHTPCLFDAGGGQRVARTAALGEAAAAPSRSRHAAATMPASSFSRFAFAGSSLATNQGYTSSGRGHLGWRQPNQQQRQQQQPVSQPRLPKFIGRGRHGGGVGLECRWY